MNAMIGITVLAVVMTGCYKRAETTDSSAVGIHAAVVEIADWQLDGEPQLVVGDALFELINGGAELYYRLGFVQALAAQSADPEGRSISLEVFEMTDTEAAHAIFVEKSGGSADAVQIGEESAFEDYYLNFRSGSFLVTITGFDSDSTTTDGLRRLADAVANALGESS